MLTVDGRCHCDRCEARTGNTYRIVGYWTNCKTPDILMLFRAGDRKHDCDCPVCGCWHTVTPARLATVDETPEAEGAR